MFETLKSSLKSVTEYAGPYVEEEAEETEDLNLENRADLEQKVRQFHLCLVELVRQFNLLDSGQELTEARDQIARFTLKFYPQITQFLDYGYAPYEYGRYLNKHLIRDGVTNGAGASIRISEWAKIIEKSFELKLEQLITPALLSQ